MKKVMFLLGFATVAVATQAQNLKSENVPAAIKLSFEKHFPNAKEVEWEKEGANYEAEFKWKEAGHSMVMDTQGNLLETELEIKVDELPEAARKYIAEKYPNQKIKEAARITLQNGAVKYEAEINGKDVMFNGNGNFIQEKSKGND